MAFRIFISHSMKPEDIAIIRPVLEHSALMGVHCYMAQHDAQGGTNLEQKIREQIHLCDCVLAFVTSNSTQSDWVKWEVGVANALQKLVVPVIEKGIQVPGFLLGKEYIECDPQDPQATTSRVTQRIHNLQIADQRKTAVAWSVLGAIALLLMFGGDDK